MDLPANAVTTSGVQDYVFDVSKDLMGLAASLEPATQALPDLLGVNPTLDLVPLLSSVATDPSLPHTVVGGDLPANLTGILADFLGGLF